MLSTATKKKLAKFIIRVCGIAFLASLAFAVSFFFRDLPNRPHPELGRIYPLNNHGYYLYLNRKEHLAQEVSEYVSFGLFLFILPIDLLFKPFEEQERMTQAWLKAELRRLWPWHHRWGP